MKPIPARLRNDLHLVILKLQEDNLKSKNDLYASFLNFSCLKSPKTALYNFCFVFTGFWNTVAKKNFQAIKGQILKIFNKCE